MAVVEPSPTPRRASISVYLAGHGWERRGTRTLDGETCDQWANYSYRGVYIRVLIPEEASPIYGERIEMLLWNLSMVEKRPEDEILDDILMMQTGA